MGGLFSYFGNQTGATAHESIIIGPVQLEINLANLTSVLATMPRVENSISKLNRGRRTCISDVTTKQNDAMFSDCCGRQSTKVLQ